MHIPTAKHSSSLLERISPRLAPPQLQRLEQWRVIKHLGSGTTSDVWLLADTDGRRQVVCKTPHTTDGASSLSQEAKLAAQLSHENLIRPIAVDNARDFGTLPAHEATFWEFLAGGTLHELVAAIGQLNVAHTVTVVLPMVQVTQYLHARQIVHGDISPNNILFDLNGRPVLIDLGSTRATAHSYSRTGTPGFVAPELLTDQEQRSGLDASADVYALAAVAWFCLTGTVPGSAEHRVPLTTLQPELDSDITDVLEAGLSTDPALRPDLDQFTTSIAHWAAPEPLDLHASVGEEYGLLLPTRQPQQEQPRKRSCHFRRLPTSKRHSKTSKRALRDNRPDKKRSQRTMLIFGALALAGGGAFTFVYAPDLPLQPSTAENGHTPSSEPEDFQAVMDELAKTRSAAWSTTDPNNVASYALTDSSVFHEDTELLTLLDNAGHHLDGLRMHAVVDDVELSTDTTVLHVRWRMDGYVQRDEAGDVIRQVESREEALELEVIDTADGWRMVTAR